MRHSKAQKFPYIVTKNTLSTRYKDEDVTLLNLAKKKLSKFLAGYKTSR